MKYKDRSTIKSWNKQIDKLDQPDSDRKLRRERERALKDFSQSICLIVGKDWWDCVDQKQKSTLYSRWLIVKYKKSIDCSQPLSLEEWIMSIKETIVIDKALYREKKINKILN